MHAQKTDILAQHSQRLRPLRQLAFGLLLLGVPTLGVVTAFGLVPGTVVDPHPLATVREALELPTFAPEVPMPSRFLAQDRVLRGDTVSALFERLGIRDPRALDFLRTDPKGGTIFRRLVPGKTLQAETGPEGELLALRYFLGADGLLEIKRQGEGFLAADRRLAEPARVFHRSATIKSSLFAATDSAGIPDAIAMQIARVFATDIDFHTDLRKGDRFSVVYEMLYDAGELIAPGRILAAEFVNGDRTHHAVLFTDEEGAEAYYGLDGSNRAKAFLRSPVEFSRVSSGFGSRFHPIFKNWRAHTGVDFAARHGTRVLAVADGHVMHAGWRNGYGNTVEIRHGSGVLTLYGHLSGFAVRSGARVRQGEPIGFVGATGYATGPHLHYEFKIAGIHQDPMRVALPKATPVPVHLKARFEVASTQARSRLALVRDVTGPRFE